MKPNLLSQAAEEWLRLTDYIYVFTYGYKNKLYNPRNYPFYTNIKADYLITNHIGTTSFIFVIQANSSIKFNYLCCSAFEQTARNYEANQRKLSLLKKERIQLSSGISQVLFNKIESE